MESRSTFVTVLAWIFIVGAGFSFIVSIMQVIMVSTMFSGEEFRSMPENAPGFAQFMLRYIHIFIYATCAAILFILASSIALLKRKNWGRLAFIGILALGILWQIGSIIMQFSMFSELPMPPPEKGFEGFERMSIIIRWFSLAIAIAISGLFIWLIKKLTSQPIVSEFRPYKQSTELNSIDINKA